MKLMKNMLGESYGRLKVIRFAFKRQTPSGQHKYYWLCICQCGQETLASSSALRSGKVNSCGCLKKERTIEANSRHGMHGSSEYWLWLGMKARCNNPAHIGYKNYGARGIKVCGRWNDFALFLQDVGSRPTPKHTLDRINNDGNYEPSNVRWATRKEQAANSRRWALR